LTAPISGVIGQKGLRKGAFVATGTTLVSIVPLDQIYVRANYRETQLARVRAGQQVSVEVDALPGTHFKGTVESIGPASGLTFAPISPQNATGNFTKIVQRLPGRIKLSPNQASIDQLRVGMSVVPEISID
jgi:membrane fusion protein (multidrug efflux system)